LERNNKEALAYCKDNRPTEVYVANKRESIPHIPAPRKTPFKLLFIFYHPQFHSLTIRYDFGHNAKHSGCTRPHYPNDPELPGRRYTRIVIDIHDCANPAASLLRAEELQNSVLLASSG
jgi:hypothetical protein